MKIRAAVLEEFAAPLGVQELDLAEPKSGEVLSFAEKGHDVYRCGFRNDTEVNGGSRFKFA